MNAVLLKKGINPTFGDPLPYDKMPKTMPVPFREEDRDDPCPDTETKTISLTNKEMETFNTKSNIYGFRTRKDNIASTPQELSAPYVSDVDYDRKLPKTVKFTEDTVNASSKTFKYGEQYSGVNNMTTDLKLILKGVQDNTPVSNSHGPPRKGAGTWSGDIGEKLKGM